MTEEYSQETIRLYNLNWALFWIILDHISQSGCATPIFTARKRSLGQGNIFRSLCQEFCSQGGIPGQVPPPGPGTPPWDQVHPPGPGTPLPGTRYTPPGPGTPPRTRYTPWDQVHSTGTRYTPLGPGTPPRTRYPPGTRYTLWDQVHPPGTRYTPTPWTRYTPPPGPGTPPQDQVHPPRTRYTPWDQVHPPGPGTPPGDQVPPRDQVHPPGSSACLGDTGNKRAVRILLECILVYNCFAENCMKMKEFGPRGGRTSLAPPSIRQWLVSNLPPHPTPLPPPEKSWIHPVLIRNIISQSV